MGQAVAAVGVLAVAVATLAAPVALVWLALVTIPRAGRDRRTDVIGGLGCGMVAAGVASLSGAAIHRFAGTAGPDRLVVSAPLVEEPLKALAIVGAIGFAAVAGADRLPLHRCAVATVTVVAAFAASENLGHLGGLFVVGGAAPADWSAVAETLRVRAVLPPIGHAAETWAVGAAIWLAARRRLVQRVAILGLGLAVAIGLHAAWNWSAQRFWPDPWPLLGIIGVSAAAAGAGYLTVARRARRARRLELPAAPVRIEPRQPAARP
jgi:RsiW-degrading membrane proteinase PrsW (M82 family)